MHIDNTLRRPDPVVFSGLAGLPFDAAEVETPLGTRDWPFYGKARLECSPGYCDLDSPTAVFVGRVVECALKCDGGLEAGNVPAIVCFAALSVGFVEIEIPRCVESVDFELEVAGSAGWGLEKDFEVVVVEDDGVVLGELGFDVGLF